MTDIAEMEEVLGRFDVFSTKREVAEAILKALPSPTDRVAKMEKALRWLADNPGAHPVNVQVIAKDALGEE